MYHESVRPNRGAVGELGEVVGPGRAGLRCRVDAAVAAGPHPPEEVDDPLALELGADRTVAERRCALGSVQHQQVGEAGDGDTEVGVDTGRPRIGQRRIAEAADVDGREAARVGVEAGSQHKDVEVDLPGSRSQTAGRDGLDRGRSQIDQLDVRLIEALVEVLLE